MDVTAKTMPALRLAAVPHTGAYTTIGPAFRTLGQIAGRAGLFEHPDARMIGIYKDDPQTTPVAQLRSAAGVVVSEDVRIPDGLVEERVDGGRFACLTHRGSYEKLPHAWRRLSTELMPAAGHRQRAAPSYERYLNDPTQVPEDALLTEICIPIE